MNHSLRIRVLEMFKYLKCLWCILTREWVLDTMFAGQNQLFHHLKFFQSEMEKKKERKKSVKINKKGSTPECWLIPKGWWTPGKK